MAKRLILLMLLSGIFSCSHAFSFNDDAAPFIRLASGGGTFAQGKTAYLYFISSEPSVEIDGIFQGKDFRAYPYHNKYRAVIGFSIDDRGNKSYPMEVTATDRKGNESDCHYRVYVKKTKFEKLVFFSGRRKWKCSCPTS
jgi:hypothetical protein